jgi:hypothetical protein
VNPTLKLEASLLAEAFTRLNGLKSRMALCQKRV